MLDFVGLYANQEPKLTVHLQLLHGEGVLKQDVLLLTLAISLNILLLNYTSASLALLIIETAAFYHL